MSLAYNVDAVNITPVKAIDTNNLIAVSISEHHDEINNDKNSKRKTKNILLKLQRKQKTALTKQEIANRVKEKYNTLNSKEKEQLNAFLNTYKHADLKKIVGNNILNIMMIIDKAWSKMMETQGVDQAQQANDILYAQSIIDKQNKNLQKDFNKTSQIEKAAQNQTGLYVTIAITIAVVLISLIVILATAGAAAPAEAVVDNGVGDEAGGLVANAAARVPPPPVVDAAAPVAAPAPAVAPAAPVEAEPVGGVQAADQPIAPETQPTQGQQPAQGQSTQQEAKQSGPVAQYWKNVWKNKSGFAQSLMVPVMLGSTVFGIGNAITNAASPSGIIGQATISADATNAQIATNITTAQNSKVQASTKRISDDSQNLQQDAGYVSQAINELGIAMTIRA
jgi:hypothetical protein